MPIEHKDKKFDESRALFGLRDVKLDGCMFEGGESALKECAFVQANKCTYDGSYPLWHNHYVQLDGCDFTPSCRAALWYSQNVTIASSKLNGAKALRECKKAYLRDCEVSSAEFGWNACGLRIVGGQASGEYFLMRASDVYVDRLKLKGKYSFQYVKNAVIDGSTVNTYAALWHCRNVTVENCIIIGEYTGWYSKNLTFKNCTLIGKQPLCYCKNLKLEDCVLQDAECAFERSQVFAVLRAKIDSIKNPTSGVIKAPEVGEIIRDDSYAKCRVLIDPYLLRDRKHD